MAFDCETSDQAHASESACCDFIGDVRVDRSDLATTTPRHRRRVASKATDERGNFRGAHDLDHVGAGCGRIRGHVETVERWAQPIRSSAKRCARLTRRCQPSTKLNHRDILDLHTAPCMRGTKAAVTRPVSNCRTWLVPSVVIAKVRVASPNQPPLLVRNGHIRTC